MLRVEASDPARGDAHGRGTSSRVYPGWRVDALALGVVAVVLRIAVFFAARSLVFDDGVFGSSALAMRAGDAPFRDVFSSQGPVFLPLVWLADLAGFRTVDAPRLLTVGAGVLVTIATYSCARHVTTRGNALFAAALVTTSGSVLWVTGPVNADGPSLALSVLALAFALRYRARPRTSTALWVGVAGGAAISIKALSVPAVLIAGLVVLLSHRRVRDAATAAGVAVGVYVLAALPWGIERVWDQSYTYHNESRRVNTPLEAAEKVVRTLWSRDLLVVVALALALGALIVRSVGRRRAHTNRRGASDGITTDDPRFVVGGLLLWVALVFALLLWEPAMWRAHIAHLVVPLALLAALRPPPWPLLLVVGMIAVPVFVADNSDILWPSGYSGHEAALVHRLRELPDRALVISDNPGWAWRSGHAPPGNFADTSYQRIDNGELTENSLARAASASDVCAVVASSASQFLRFPGLDDRLATEGYEPTRFGPRITLYLRSHCMKS
ncbi:MAG: ArnT family glycosyltransferase [Acidimicrobiia bacterium]